MEGLRDRGTGNAFLDLLKSEDVLIELKVDDFQKSEINDQFREIKALHTEMQKVRSTLSSKFDRPNREFSQVVAKLSNATEGFQLIVEDILDPLQVGRLVGLFCQQEGGMAIFNLLVAERIGLSPSQRAKAAELLKKSVTEKMDFQSKDAMTVLMRKRKETEGLILDLLTEEQKNTFATLKGGEFKPIQSRLNRSN